MARTLIFADQTTPGLSRRWHARKFGVISNIAFTALLVIAREEVMKRCTSVLALMAFAASSALAAEVTPERLLGANLEPQNWLMNHRTYDGQRFSPLARITKDNVKNLKLAYAVPLGGSTGNEWLEATALVEDGFIY